MEVGRGGGIIPKEGLEVVRQRRSIRRYLVVVVVGWGVGGVGVGIWEETGVSVSENCICAT